MASGTRSKSIVDDSEQREQNVVQSDATSTALLSLPKEKLVDIILQLKNDFIALKEISIFRDRPEKRLEEFGKTAKLKSIILA